MMHEVMHEVNECNTHGRRESYQKDTHEDAVIINHIHTHTWKDTFQLQHRETNKEGVPV
jgi:hypothetical protein